MKLLLTGFTPFDGETINPALEAVKRVKSEIAGMEIVKLEVPTVFGESVRLVAEAIESNRTLCSRSDRRAAELRSRRSVLPSMWTMRESRTMRDSSRSMSRFLRTAKTPILRPCR